MKTTNSKWARILAQTLILAMLICALPFGAAAAEIPQSQATFTFTEQAITGEGAVVANEISGTTLTIKQSGVYTLTGSCSEGNVIVSKGVTGVTLILKDLKLESEKAAPICIEAKAETTIYLIGTSALNNKAVRPAKEEKPAEPAAPAEPEAPAETEGASATVEARRARPAKNAENSEKAPKGNGFVGAAIKVKSNAKLVVTGEGVLFLNGAVKNPISCAKNAKAVLKGNALNFNKKRAQKAEKPAPVETPIAEPAEVTEPAEPAAETAEPAAEAAEAPTEAAEPAAEAAEPVATEDGASATVNAKKNGQNPQKGKKGKQGKPLEIKAGDVLTVKDAEGNAVLSAEAPIDAKQVIFVSEKLAAKQSYVLFAGETQASKATARAFASLKAASFAKNGKNGKSFPKGGKFGKGRNKNSAPGQAAEPAAAPAEATSAA